MRNCILAGVVLTALIPMAAYSKDLCFTMNEGLNVAHIKYTGVKSLSKKGSIVQLKGVMNWEASPLFTPISEAAVVMADGTVTFGFQGGYISGANELLAGGQWSSGAASFTSLDCKLFPAY